MERVQTISDGGFTLIEVIIVVTLVALVSALSVVGLRSLTKTDLRGTATHMAGAVRYLFDRASTTGRVHRLVLDFDTGKYWAEVSDEQFFFAAGKETDETRKKEAERVAKEEEAKRAAAEKEAFFGSSIPARYLPKPFEVKRAKFNAFRETAVKPVTLKSGALLADIYTPRLQKPLSEGQGYLYFFPMGMTEAAVIHLSDKQGETFYSLVVHPLTGRVTVKNSYVEVNPREQVDDAGKVVNQ